MMRRRGLLLLGAGLIAAIAAAILVFYLSTPPPPPPGGTTGAGPTATPIPVAQVVVAKRDIAPGQQVSGQDVETRTFPLSVILPDAIRDPASVISKTATAPIFGGQTLLSRQFGPAGPSQPTAPELTAIPKGKVLMAFPATGMLESTGAVQKGDQVDIMITLPVSGTVDLQSNGAPAQGRPGDRSVVSQATLQNITVYSTGLWTPQGGAATAGEQPVKVLTFIVDHQEALILKYIKDSGGTIDLVIRSAQDTNQVPTDAGLARLPRRPFPVRQPALTLTTRGADKEWPAFMTQSTVSSIINIVVADADPDDLARTRALLLQDRNIQVVATATERNQVLPLLELEPEVFLLSSNIDPRDTTTLIKQLLELSPSTQVLLVTDSNDTSEMRRAVVAGRARHPAQAAGPRRADRHDPRGHRGRAGPPRAPRRDRAPAQGKGHAGAGHRGFQPQGRGGLHARGL